MCALAVVHARCVARAERLPFWPSLPPLSIPRCAEMMEAIPHRNPRVPKTFYPYYAAGGTPKPLDLPAELAHLFTDASWWPPAAAAAAPPVSAGEAGAAGGDSVGAPAAKGAGAGEAVPAVAAAGGGTG